jgi:hypothetical protein
MTATVAKRACLEVRLYTCIQDVLGSSLGQETLSWLHFFAIALQFP